MNSSLLKKRIAKAKARAGTRPKKGKQEKIWEVRTEKLLLLVKASKEGVFEELSTSLLFLGLEGFM